MMEVTFLKKMTNEKGTSDSNIEIEKDDFIKRKIS